jgi:hypothetical protein
MAKTADKPEETVSSDTRIIKHRLFTWFEQVQSPHHPDEMVMTERINHMGDEVEITNPDYLKRGESLGAFYTDAEADQIRKGTYRGFDAETLYRFRGGQMAAPQAEENAVDGEGTQEMSAEQLADWIVENKPTVDQTVALSGDDLESIERVLDAENIATDNSPRSGVVNALEAKMRAATS